MTATDEGKRLSIKLAVNTDLLYRDGSVSLWRISWSLNGAVCSTQHVVLGPDTDARALLFPTIH